MGAYSGTILDSYNPLGTMNIVQGMLNDNLGENYGYGYDTEEIDALRHYITMQSIADQYGTTIAGGLGKIWEGKANDKYDIQREVDLMNNMRALEDYEKGNILELNTETQSFDKPVLDSLLQEITIPPPEDSSGKPNILDFVKAVSGGKERRENRTLLQELYQKAGYPFRLPNAYTDDEEASVRKLIKQGNKK